MKNNNHIIYYFILSFIAVIFVIVIVLFGKSSIESNNDLDKYILVGILTITCVFGISLSYHPGWIKQIFRKRKEDTIIKKSTRKRKGHHPSCEKFQYHTIQIKNKTLCTGCLGLSIGGILSLILLIIYLNLRFNATPLISLFIVLLGIILIFFSYLESIIPRRYKILHIITNINLVIGFILVTIGVFESTRQILYAFIGITLSVLWLDTRIQLSTWNHRSICNNCVENCKIY